MGKKITIGEARESGAVSIIVYCAGSPATAGGCTRTVELTLMHAIALWGAERRLDDILLYCSACGSRSVDVRPRYESKPVSADVELLMRKAWDRER